MTQTSVEQDQVPVRKAPILLCLALMLAFPFFSPGMQQAVDRLALSIGEIPARAVTEAAIWMFALGVLGIALLGERRTLASIGLQRPNIWTPLWGAGAAIALLALGGLASYVTYVIFHGPNRTPAQVEAIVRGSLVYAIFLALRAGVIEEILYRGLAIEQLTALIGSRAMAAVIATLVFIAAHLVHFDPRQLIPIAVATVGFTVLYVWRHNLWINITAHTLIDAVALGAVAMHATRLY